jgi:hypothetical protein
MMIRTVDNTLNQITVSVPPDAYTELVTAACANGFTLDHWCSLMVMRSLVEDRLAAEEGSPAAHPGNTNPMSKLTDTQAREILALKDDPAGYSARAVGERYGISRQSVADIWARRAWRHL